MSGHSKWATTHRQKAAADAKKGAAFTKLANMITVAAREGGGDPEANFKLRLAIDKARAANMPKDNIERAISKGTGANKDGANFEEVIYEIIGPAGTGLIVEAVTDNRNRTAADLKAILNKYGGTLGGANSVAWNFKRQGVIRLEATNLTDNDELKLIDAGAEEIEKSKEGWQVTTLPENLMAVTGRLKKLSFAIKETSLAFIPREEVKISEPQDREQIERLYNLLTDLDDVNSVYTNATW
jgi:YebC/PmpR family DNA-binding regulatory protein